METLPFPTHPLTQATTARYYNIFYFEVEQEYVGRYGEPYHRYMLADVARHAERILTVKTMSLTMYSMHDSYRMSPEDIRRESLGEEVRSLLRCRHVDQLYLLSGYLVANPVVLNADVLRALMMHWIHGKLSS